MCESRRIGHKLSETLLIAWPVVGERTLAIVEVEEGWESRHIMFLAEGVVLGTVQSIEGNFLVCTE